MAAQYYEGIGRRKAASARVRIFPGGTGNLTINDKDGTDYLPRPGDVEILLAPLGITGNQKNMDVTVHVNGGGISGQRDAILLGLARALIKLDPELKPQLRHSLAPSAALCPREGAVGGGGECGTRWLPGARCLRWPPGMAYASG